MIKVSLPKKPKYQEKSENVGIVEIEACYPGYGATLGNALRRVLLSSLTGTAVTSVKIKGISHEFSTLPGVKQDLIQIILNLKKIRFKSHKDEPVKLTLKQKGAKIISAAEIQCPADVEVVNKDALVAELTDKKTELDMEIEIQKGLGYVPVEQQDREKKEIGLIAIDAIFTPVKRVNYAIENMRVGKRTDFEKITLEIETDGTMTPREAFEEAASIVIQQFDIIKTIESEEEAGVRGALAAETDAQKKEDESPVIHPVPDASPDDRDTDVTALSFSTRTLNVLQKNNIKKVSELIRFSENELKNFEGMGEKGLKEIKKAIGNFGLTLK